MPLPSGLRAAGEVLSNAGFTPNVETHQMIRNSRPTDAFNDVDRLGQNGDIITGSAWTGGLGRPMNEEFRSAMDARDRLNDLREIGVYR